jgi:cyclopropane-fatty-acyl-phospholipid synthase
MYSCALWSSKEGGPTGDIDPVIQPGSITSSPSSSTGTLVTMPSDDLRLGELEAAQQRKIAHVLEALRLHPGSRVLEFGTGWGALAIAAAQYYGAEVDTLTLSIEQKALAEERIRAAGLQDRIRVHLMDYRHTPREWDGYFDAFVSIEMIEHVGPNHYQHYFSIVDRALKPSDATAVVTGSTFPESRYTTKQ